jgi:YVTN family beta-propeller protein
MMDGLDSRYTVAQLFARLAEGIRDGKPISPGFDAAVTRHRLITGPRGNVSIIDTATNMVTANILVGSFPTGVAVTPDGRKVYVANQSSANVSVIAAKTNTLTATIAVGSEPTGVAVTPGRLPDHWDDA